MPAIERLVAGFRAFRATHFEQRPDLYEALAGGQSPEVLMIACSDSRVDPAILLNAQPGELFVVRNVANLVPPYQPDARYHGTSAAVEFAVRDLGVRHVVVLGHSRCGGMGALRHYAQGGSLDREFIGPWVTLASEACSCLHGRPELAEAEAAVLVEQAAVRLSLRNLGTFPWLRERVADGRLRLHGWWFDLEAGALWGLGPDGEGFERLG